MLSTSYIGTYHLPVWAVNYFLSDEDVELSEEREEYINTWVESLELCGNPTITVIDESEVHQLHTLWESDNVAALEVVVNGTPNNVRKIKMAYGIKGDKAFFEALKVAQERGKKHLSTPTEDRDEECIKWLQNWSVLKIAVDSYDTEFKTLNDVVRWAQFNHPYCQVWAAYALSGEA